jgi:hypothetical protein
MSCSEATRATGGAPILSLIMHNPMTAGNQIYFLDTIFEDMELTRDKWPQDAVTPVVSHLAQFQDSQRACPALGCVKQEINSSSP